MAPFILILLSLSISIWEGDAQTNVQGFRLVQQWPAAYCSLNPAICNRPSLVSYLTIHGLWPYDRNGSSLVDCGGPNFNISSISNTLRNQLDRDWPNFRIGGGNVDFWSYEWRKHGKCSASILTQPNYFQTSVDRKNSFDILAALNTAGITPNDGLYAVQNIYSAIASGLHVAPTIICKTNRRGDVLLSEIYFCLNRLGQAFINCPGTQSRGCGSSVKFISISYTPKEELIGNEEDVGKNQTAIPARSNTNLKSINGK